MIVYASTYSLKLHAANMNEKHSFYQQYTKHIAHTIFIYSPDLDIECVRPTQHRSITVATYRPALQRSRNHDQSVSQPQLSYVFLHSCVTRAPTYIL